MVSWSMFSCCSIGERIFDSESTTTDSRRVHNRL